MIIIAFLFSAGAVALSENCEVYLPSECLEVLKSHVSSSQVEDFRGTMLLRLQVSVKCKVDAPSAGIQIIRVFLIKSII